jgi:hypothetical protein
MILRQIHVLTLGEITVILDDEWFENTASEVLDHTDTVVCPPKVDSFIDNNEGPHDVIIVVEVHYMASGICEDRQRANLLPSIKQQSPGERCLFYEKSNWLETA